MEFVPLRDQNLSLDEVDTGDNFGDRMFHLDSWIDFDEIPLLRIHVVQKLHRAGVAIIRFACQPHCCIAQFRADARWQIRGRCNLNDFFMPQLHRTIALVKMQQIAMMIGENLDFQMPRPRQIFLQENGSVAKRRLGFTLRFLQSRRELRFIVNHAHSAPAAAHGGLHDYRVPDILGNLVRFRGGLHCVFGAW